MSYEQDRFNDGVELAYLLDEAIDINSSLQAGKAIGLEALDEYCDRANKTASNHSKLRSHIPPHNSGYLTFLPEVYDSILNSAEGMFFARAYGEFSGRTAEEYSPELISYLIKAVDELIGRDVYIQGMNPSEFSKAA